MADLEFELVDEENSNNEGGIELDILDPGEQDYIDNFNFFEGMGLDDFVRFAHERSIYTVKDLVDNADKLIFEYKHDHHFLEHQERGLNEVINKYRELLNY